ncbi:MAG TPA: hypothetical protein VJK54_07075 [Chthoniobacterales bacterium]|nr:hypothetical protein [Chthoniobacterales bacterium]
MKISILFFFGIAFNLILHVGLSQQQVTDQQIEPMLDGNLQITNCHLMMEPNIPFDEIEKIIKSRENELLRLPNKVPSEETTSIVSRASLDEQSRTPQISPTPPTDFNGSNFLNNSEQNGQPINSTSWTRSASYQRSYQVWMVFLYNALEHAQKTLQELQKDVEAARYIIDLKFSNMNSHEGMEKNSRLRAWDRTIAAAECVVQYIKNCISDHEAHFLYPQALVAIDRAEETLKFRIKDAKSIRGVYQQAQNMESSAKYMVNSILAEKAANKFLAQRWIEVAQLAISNKNQFSPSIGKYIGNIIVKKVSKDSHNVIRYNEYEGLKKAESLLIDAHTYDTYAAKAKTLNNERFINLWKQAALQSRIACISLIKANLFSNFRNYDNALCLKKIATSEIKKRNYLLTLARQEASLIQSQSIENQEFINSLKQIKEPCQSLEKNKRFRTKRDPLALFANKLSDSLEVEKMIDDYNSKATQAQLSNNQKLAYLWQYVAKQAKMLYEMDTEPMSSQINRIYGTYFKETDNQGNTPESKTPYNQYLSTLFNFVNSLEQSTNRWNKISEYKTKITKAESTGNQEAVQFLTAAIKHIQTAAENSIEASFFHINGNRNEFHRLTHEAEAEQLTADQFAKLADCRMRVPDFKSMDHQNINELLKEIIHQIQVTEENRVKKNEAFFTGHIDDADLIEKKLLRARHHVDTLIETFDTLTQQLALADYALYQANRVLKTASHEEITNCWNKIEKHYRNAAHYKIKTDAKKDALSAQRILDFIYISEEVADYTAHALSAKSQGNEDLGNAWSNLAEQTKILANLSIQKDQMDIDQRIAYKNKQSQLTDMNDIIEYLTQAAIARVSGNQDLSNIWILGVKQLEKSLEYSSHGIHDLYISAKVRAYILALAAKYSVESKESTTEEIIYWSKQAAQELLQTFEYEDQSATAFLNDNKDDANFLAQAAAANWNAAEMIIKIIEAYERGETQINFLQERMEQFKTAAERFSKAASSQLAGNYRAAHLWNQAAVQIGVVDTCYQDFFLSLHDDLLNNDHQAGDFAKSVGNELAKIATLLETCDTKDLDKECNIKNNDIEVKYQTEEITLPQNQAIATNNLNNSVQEVVNLFIKTAEYNSYFYMTKNTKSTELMNLWDKATQQSQLAAINKAKEIMNTMEGREETAYLPIITQTLEDSANNFAQAAEALAAGDKETSYLLVQTAEEKSQLAEKQKTKGLMRTIDRGINNRYNNRNNSSDSD